MATDMAVQAAASCAHLITQPQPLAVLSTALIEQAQRHYDECFEVGRDSLS